jgi:hypothetical protein
MKIGRRGFMASTAGAGLLAAGVGAQEQRAPRQKGKSVAGLQAPRLEKVRIGVIGLGMRGSGAVHRLTKIEGVEIKAICDLVPDKIKRAQKTIADAGQKAAAEYGPAKAQDWQKLCERDDLDLVYICTPWELHTPNAVHAMKHGKHAATEVPAAVTLKECWQLVDTAEETQKNCMMLENCCYDFLELCSLNMVRQGVFGELVHAECAYIHDLRSLKFDKNGYHDMWRLRHNIKRDGNLYPTHGLGPVAQCMNINRGDRMEYLTSMSSRPLGMGLYAAEHHGDNSPEAKQEYRLGDMNTTLVRTALGRTIMIQHDTTSPRPYSRIHLLSGTRGVLRKWPESGMALEPNAHEWMSDEDFKKIQEKYEHPLVKKIGAIAKKVGGHGGMDFIMDWRLITCLQSGEALDQDVYDAASWSAICECSERSVAHRSESIEIPDFTRGKWKTNQPLGIVS